MAEPEAVGGDAPPRRPKSGGTNVTVVVVSLLLVVAGGIAAVGIQVAQGRRASSESATATATQAAVSAPSTPAQGKAPEHLGRGSAVRIIGVVPNSSCHVEVCDALRDIAKDYPDIVNITLYQMGDPEGTRALGASCAGYAINGKSTYSYTDTDGKKRTYTFQKSPEQGGWTVAALQAAVLDAIRKAKENPPPEEKPSTTPEPEATASGALIGRYGRGSAVKVAGAVPDSACHAEVCAVLRKLAEEHPEELEVTLYRMQSPEAVKAVGITCAGYAIDGSTSYTLKGADGTERKLKFEKSPELGEWSAADLEAAVLDALAKARSEGKAGSS